jgi:hypothetical protein
MATTISEGVAALAIKNASQSFHKGVDLSPHLVPNH